MFLFGFFKIILITIITFMIISFTGIFTNWRFSKDDAISKYTSALQTLGDFSLTSNAKLQGKREFGKDHYTGKYSVNYKYFTGEEIVFGGTELGGNKKLRVKAELNNTNGEAKVIFQNAEEEIILIENNGTYDNVIDISEGGSNYLKIETNNFLGSAYITVDYE